LITAAGTSVGEIRLLLGRRRLQNVPSTLLWSVEKGEEHQAKRLNTGFRKSSKIVLNQIFRF
jgi:hypothetical protein